MPSSRRRRERRCAALLLLLGCAACARPAPAPPPLAAAEVRTLRARFHAVAQTNAGERAVAGVLIIERPDAVRLRLIAPFGVTVLDYVRSDGTAYWWMATGRGETPPQALALLTEVDDAALPEPPSRPGRRFEDYRSVDGVLLPFRITVTAPQAGTVAITIERWEVNPTLPPDAFAPPPDAERIPAARGSSAGSSRRRAEQPGVS